MPEDRSLELMELGALTPNPENPKAHNLGLLGASIEHFGYVEPIVRDERTGYVISGHGRLELLRDRQAAGKAVPEGVVVRDGQWLVPVVRGWASKDDGDARAVLVALNQVGPAGGWDSARLAVVLQAVSEDQLLALTGFSEADLTKLILSNQPGSDGSLLARSDVTLGEPEHQTALGERYRLAGRHHLVVADVMEGWDAWASLLVGDLLFVPYPGPYAAVSEAATKHPLLLVQPEPYIAGHLLDKFAAIHGAEQIEKVTT
jgi:hypothetical protein